MDMYNQHNNFTGKSRQLADWQRRRGLRLKALAEPLR
jgi:hypothetical protein